MIGLPMPRVIAYIDGFNLYYGLRANRWKRFYWLNLRQAVLHLLKPDQTLVRVKYFTSLVAAPLDKNRRQAVFLEALGTLPDFTIYFGHYLAGTVVCRQCGHTYTTHHEKMTDVNIATEILSDAFTDRFDAALLISADSDLVGPVQKVRQLFPQKRVIVVFPPARHSNALKNAANATLHLDRATLAQSVFPDQVVKSDGFVLHRPAEWH
jgi:uncharacterized LabA/DUF88 family protein